MKEKTKHHKHNISAGFHPGIDKEEEEEEMKEKTKHHKHNISARFHPGIDKYKVTFLNYQNCCQPDPNISQDPMANCSQADFHQIPFLCFKFMPISSQFLERRHLLVLTFLADLLH